ncbi:MAG: hypothetical protein PUA78_05940 [Porphyromonadaceae bacterium]|nr:hypothetical protein [Porphyromonadaceae bacterium]
MKPKYLHLLASGAAFTALATVLPLGLSSCSNDDLDSPGGRSASMMLTVAKGDIDNTRTQLREENGSLVASWTAGENPDRLLVADASGRRLGYLTLTSIDPQDASVATFNGNLDGLSDDDTQQLRLFYLGTKADATTATAPLTLGYADQRGTMESLTDADLLTGEVTATLQGSVIAANDRAVLERKVAHAHFKLDLPVAATEPMTVTITGDNVKNSIVMESFNGDFRTADGPITVTATAAGDFYMTVVPAEAVTLTFTTSVGGKSYRGTLPSRNWNNQEYVRAGEDDGVAITMTEYSDPYAEYADEDPRNPLHKFAKYNLTREGDSSSWSNVFTASETENGALYQWGRNYGYMDSQGMYSNTSSPFYYPLNDFSNYLDAQGSFDNNSAGDNMFYGGDYFVYNGSNKNLTSGTGISQNYSGTFVHWTREYSSVADIKSHPTKFFMDGTIKNVTDTKDGKYLLVCTTGDDYWVFNEFGGSDWESRATACGYEKANPCPEGWRLPTKEEFAAIAPPTSMTSSTGTSMANMLSGANGYDVRELNGVRFAIRWIAKTDYLEIQAVVVDNNFTKSDVSSLFWDQNIAKTVIRKFPYTGAIYNMVDYDYIDSILLGVDYFVARPYHMGQACWDYYYFGGSDMVQQWLVISAPDEYKLNRANAYYWTGDDSREAFLFTDPSRAAGNGKTASTPYLGMKKTDAVRGLAIRPVMDL